LGGSHRDRNLLKLNLTELNLLELSSALSSRCVLACYDCAVVSCIVEMDSTLPC